MQNLRIVAAEALVLLPRERGVLQPVQGVVDLPQNAVDLGRRARRLLLGQPQVKGGGVEVLQPDVGERQLREREPVLHVEAVCAFEKLGGAARIAAGEIRRSRFGELLRERDCSGASGGDVGGPAEEIRYAPLEIGRGRRDLGQDRLGRQRGEREEHDRKRGDHSSRDEGAPTGQRIWKCASVSSGAPFPPESRKITRSE